MFVYVLVVIFTCLLDSTPVDAADTCDVTGSAKSRYVERKMLQENEMFTLQSMNYGINYGQAGVCLWNLKCAATDPLFRIDCGEINIHGPNKRGKCKKDFILYKDENKKKSKFCGEKNTDTNRVVKGYKLIFKFVSKPKKNWNYTGFSCNVTCESKFSPESGSICDCTKFQSQIGSGKIVGGTEVNKNSIPSMVKLYIESNRGNISCGGTLISPDYVVTAAHCLDFSTIARVIVVVGEHNLTDSADSGTNHYSSDIISHENYNKTTLENDIALIKLMKPVTCDTKVRPACLPSTAPNVGDLGIAAGWGTTSSGGSISTVLLSVNLTVISNADCNKENYGYVLDGMLCATKPGKDSCQGDSGGPLFTFENDIDYVSGIVSWGFGCATSPGVYTDVAYYIVWIRKNMI